MPQMMPINWLLSLMLFICIFILFNIINYFIFNYNYNKKMNKISTLNSQFYWKW